MMKNKLKWRLGKLPTPDEVSQLVNDKIITKEEAREILFTLETEEDKSAEDLKSEIKFLRELVDRLANHSSYKIVEVIKEVAPIYSPYPWNRPYMVWCTNTSTSDSTSGMYVATSATNSGGSTTVALSNSGFTDIKTF